MFSINNHLLLNLFFIYDAFIYSRVLKVSQLLSMFLIVSSGTPCAFFLAHCLALKAQGVSGSMILISYPFSYPASTYFFISHSLMFVLSTTMIGFPWSMDFTVLSMFFAWYSGIIFGSQTYLPLTIKKSSVEYTSPYSPANTFALVDLPDPGNPRTMQSTFSDLSPSIILLLLYSHTTQRQRSKIGINNQWVISQQNNGVTFYNYSTMQMEGERVQTNMSDQQGVDLDETNPPTKTRVYLGFLRACFPFGIHISIGPDFELAKLTFIFLLMLSGACYYFSLKLNFQATGQNVTLFFVTLPIISYLFTSLGNPGVYDYSKNNEPKTKYCKQCELAKPKGVIHCKVCCVCIEGLDHHCPFTSKCIGRKNKISFYVFLSSLLGLFMYFGVLIFMWIFKPATPASP